METNQPVTLERDRDSKFRSMSPGYRAMRWVHLKALEGSEVIIRTRSSSTSPATGVHSSSESGVYHGGCRWNSVGCESAIV